MRPRPRAPRRRAERAPPARGPAVDRAPPRPARGRGALWQFRRPDAARLHGVGPAVNEVARIAALCRSLDQTLVGPKRSPPAAGRRRSRLIGLGRTPCAASAGRRCCGRWNRLPSAAQSSPGLLRRSDFTPERRALLSSRRRLDAADGRVGRRGTAGTHAACGSAPPADRARPGGCAPGCGTAAR